jgi:putative phosphoribosyl transferase
MLKSLKAKFKIQLNFKDRANAANILAAALSDRLDKQERVDAHILGIPRGGVIVADVVASKIQASNFNIIVPRKLTVSHDEETAFGAVMLDGMTYLNNDSQITSPYIESEKMKQIHEIKRRMQLYLSTDNMDYLNISKIDNNSTVILVDDGIASGSTFIVAARWLKKYYDPKKLVVAATVAPKETVEILKKEVDYVEVITKPPTSSFHYVGQYYQDFAPVTDEQVVQIMKKRNVL